PTRTSKEKSFLFLPPTCASWANVSLPLAFVFWSGLSSAATGLRTATRTESPYQKKISILHYLCILCDLLFEKAFALDRFITCVPGSIRADGQVFEMSRKIYLAFYSYPPRPSRFGS